MRVSMSGGGSVGVVVGGGGIEAVPGVMRRRWKYDQVGLRNVDCWSMCGFSVSLRLRFFVFVALGGGAGATSGIDASAFEVEVRVSAVR